MLIFYQVLIIYYIKSLLLLFMTVAYWASLIAQLVKNSSAVQETPVDSWVGKICWRRNRVPTPVFFGLPYGSAGKESACNAGNLGLISGLRRSPGERKVYPLQYSGLENSMACMRASLIAQLVKDPSAILETQVQFLDREDPLEKG